MFVKFVSVLKRAKNYCFTDWNKEGKIRTDLAEYRRIEHLDEPTHYKKNNFKR